MNKRKIFFIFVFFVRITLCIALLIVCNIIDIIANAPIQNFIANNMIGALLIPGIIHQYKYIDIDREYFL